MNAARTEASTGNAASRPQRRGPSAPATAVSSTTKAAVADHKGGREKQPRRGAGRGRRGEAVTVLGVDRDEDRADYGREPAHDSSDQRAPATGRKGGGRDERGRQRHLHDQNRHTLNV